MRVVLAGASGFLGGALREHLSREGHDVVGLTRHEPAGPGWSRWDPAGGHVDRAVIEEADVVVNTAGSPLAGNPHSEKYRTTLMDSRVDSTRTLAEAIAASDRRPAFLAQNGTSVYGDRGDEVLTEDSGTAPGSYLTEVTRAWEAATEAAVDAGARVCVMRTAPVLDRAGGSLPPILWVFRTGLAGTLGRGEQYFPIIALDDWVRAVTLLATREDLRGPFNVVAPEPCTNAEFTRALGHRLHRPTVLRAPAPLVRVGAGRLSGELLGSFRVRPERLLAAGFHFEHADVESILDEALHR